MRSTLESRRADLEVRTISGVSPDHRERPRDSTLHLVANAVLPRVR